MALCVFRIEYAVAALCFAVMALPHAHAAKVNPQTLVLFDPAFVDVDRVRACFVSVPVSVCSLWCVLRSLVCPSTWP